MPVHLIFIHFSLFNCSGVLKISRRFVFPLCIRSSSFETAISFKPFNSTGAICLFKQSLQRCFFKWALTQRSFPRILPDSSNFLGAIPKFFSKFDVRMNYHQSNVFLQDLSNSFIIGSTFLIFIPEYLNNSWWCFSSQLSDFEDRRRVLPPYFIRSLRDSSF